MKYVVMECHLSYAVVLAEDGRFLRTANLHYEPGDVVTEIVEMQTPQQLSEGLSAAGKKTSGKSVVRPLMMGAATAAACLVLFVTSLFSQSRTAYASVFLTINPQVRIDVNKKNVVVGIEGVNEDGRALIEGYSYKRKQLDPVMDELLDLAIADGYLAEGGEVTVTLDSADTQWEASVSAELNRHLKEYLSETIAITIELEPSDYSESDYAESDYIESDQTESDDKISEQIDAPVSVTIDAEDKNGDLSDYSDHRDEGSSPYDADDSDEGSSPYDADDSDEGSSPYDADDSDEGSSPYDADDSDEGSSPYHEDDGITDYDEHDGVTDYDDDED